MWKNENFPRGKKVADKVEEWKQTLPIIGNTMMVEVYLFSDNIYHHLKSSFRLHPVDFSVLILCFGVRLTHLRNYCALYVEIFATKLLHNYSSPLISIRISFNWLFPNFSTPLFPCSIFINFPHPLGLSFLQPKHFASSSISHFVLIPKMVINGNCVTSHETFFSNKVESLS